MVKKAKKNLEKNGFEVLLVKSGEEALEIAKTYIKSGQKIGLGGSETVANIGLFEYLLAQDDIVLCNQYENGIDMEENMRRRREGILSDLFITSSNAITENGEIVNADGSGNRVAALIFGPKKVLIIASANKIVKNLEEGFRRVREVASVKNVERINKKAIENGKEPIYNLDNIAKKFTYIKADEQGRTTILLITDEEYGY